MLILGKTGTRMYLRKESECQRPIALIILSGIPIICAVVAAQCENYAIYNELYRNLQTIKLNLKLNKIHSL